jgi:hypothetical protein
MHGPTCIFWANLTTFSLRCDEPGLCAVGTDSDDCHSACTTDLTSEARYHFNGNADDSSGSNHGTVSGASLATDRDGVANAAYSFDGDDFITVETPFTRAGQDFSLALWLSPSVINDAGWHGFVGYQAGSRSPSLWVNHNANGQGDGMHWDTRTTQAGDGTRYTGVVPGWFLRNTYVHTVWTKGSRTNKFYKDGAKVEYEATAAVTVDLHGSYWVGKVDNFFMGTIDDVAFYSYALSAADIAQLFEDPCDGADAAALGPDSCPWALDSECDLPPICADGTDTSDCRSFGRCATSGASALMRNCAGGGIGHRCESDTDCLAVPRIYSHAEVPFAWDDPVEEPYNNIAHYKVRPRRHVSAPLAPRLCSAAYQHSRTLAHQPSTPPPGPALGLGVVPQRRPGQRLPAGLHLARGVPSQRRGRR